MTKRRSYAERYFELVLSGDITACRKIRKLAEKMLPQIRGGYKQWHFDVERASRPIQFIEAYCFIPSGKLKQPFLLEPFQKAMVECAFGFVDDDGHRRFHEVLCMIGRKNGKSSLLGALELYMLIADKEGAPQIYNVANSEDQAKLAFNAALRILRQSKPIQKYAYKRADDIYCSRNLGYMKPLTSQTRNLDGLDVHFGVIDELSAIVNRDLYDLVKQGMAAREQPMLFTITTNGFVRGGVFDSQYDYASRWLDGNVDDDRFLAFVYELDDREEWEDESCWAKANPGLGTIKKLDYLRAQVNKARQDSSYLPTVLTKDFNIPENSATAWLDFEEAVNEEPFTIVGNRDLHRDDPGKFLYGICGFDASDTIDLTSAQMLMMRPDDDHIYSIGMYWIPEDAIEAAYEKGDRKGRDYVPYEQWIARGLLRTVPGNKIDKRVLLEWLEEVKEEYDVFPFAVGLDPWHIDDSTLRELEMYVGKDRVMKVRQGPATLSQPMKQLRADYRANRIVDGHNPINEWCRMNVTVRTDVNANIQPYKKELNPRNRIDGFMAELDAYVTLGNMMDIYQQAIR